jgi:glutamate racemase
MLVHVVEEGLADSAEAELLVRHYVAGRPEIDTLILGCTHYPLLRTAIQRVVGDDVTLVDSAEATADAVSGSMDEVPASGEGGVVHFVTGDAAAFAHTARVIGGVAGEVRLLPVTDLLAYRGDGGEARVVGQAE